MCVLLPGAPVPLPSLLALWGITDVREAQDAVQVFAMQGVIKLATLPDGASWALVCQEHQQMLLVRRVLLEQSSAARCTAPPGDARV